MTTSFRALMMLVLFVSMVHGSARAGEPMIPVSIPMPKGLEIDIASVEQGKAELVLTPGAALHPPVQLQKIGPWAGQAACILPSADWLDAMKAGKFEVVKRPNRADIFRLDDVDAKHLRLFDDNRPVLTYNYGMLLKPGVPANRKRASYIHPIYGLDGEMLTDDFPRDHYHHRGVMWVWPHITVKGRGEVSTWDIRGIRQQFGKVLGVELGPVCATFGVENHWIVGKDKVATETIWIRVFRAGPIGRAIDVHLTWTAGDKPIEVRGQRSSNKGYGGFCYRPLSKKDVVITGSKGVLGKDTLHERFPWADYSAKFEKRDKHSGITILAHPGNPGYPNEWIARHYGFLGCSWPGTKPVTFEPGKPITLEYRLWLHRGDAKGGRSARINEAYRAMTR